MELCAGWYNMEKKVRPLDDDDYYDDNAAPPFFGDSIRISFSFLLDQ